MGIDVDLSIPAGMRGSGCPETHESWVCWVVWPTRRAVSDSDAQGVEFHPERKILQPCLRDSWEFILGLVILRLLVTFGLVAQGGFYHAAAGH